MMNTRRFLSPKHPARTAVSLLAFTACLAFTSALSPQSFSSFAAVNSAENPDTEDIDFEDADLEDVDSEDVNSEDVDSEKVTETGAPRLEAGTETPWYEEYTYEANAETGILTLQKYNGTETDLIVPGTADIGGKEYRVALQETQTGLQSISGPFVENENITSIIFRDGVLFPELSLDLFSHCKSLTKVDLSGADTSAVIDMSYMFRYCSSLTDIDLSMLDTSHVEGFASMFSNCTSLKTVDMHGLDTSSLTTLYSMFFRCPELTSFNFSGWDTSSVFIMDDMFFECQSLASADLSAFDTSSLEMAGGLFSHCTNLENVNLGGLDFSSLDDGSGMFYGIEHLKTVTAPLGLTVDIPLPAPLYDEDGNECDSLPQNLSQSVTLRDTVAVKSISLNHTGLNLYAGESVQLIPTIYPANAANQEVVWESSNVSAATVDDSGLVAAIAEGEAVITVTSADGGKTAECTVAILPEETPWYKDYDYRLDDDNSTLVLDYYKGTETELYVPASEEIGGREYRVTMQASGNGNRDSDGPWRMNRSITSITFEEGVLFPSSAGFMFDGCTALLSADLTKADTSQVTGTNYMFRNCDSLTEIDLRGIDYSHVTDSIHMFDGCDKLENINMSGLDASSLMYASDMFANCPRLRLLAAPTGLRENSNVALPKTLFGEDGNAYTVLPENLSESMTLTDTAPVWYTAPVLNSISNRSAGVAFSWKPAEGVSRYRVFRKEGAGEYRKLKDTAAVSILDTAVTSGVSYTYTVSCLSEDGKTAGNKNEAGRKISFLATPAVNAPTSAAAGVRVSWPTVPGASKYVILRHTGTGTPTWKWLKTVTAGTGSSQSYTDTSKDIRSGSWYAYTIRAINAEGTYSGQVGGRSIKYLAPVELTKVQSISTGVRLIFTNIEGGYTYRLYRSTKTGGKFGPYEKITDLTKVWNGYPQNVWIQDTTAKAGTTCRYYVRCVSKDGKVPLSSYKNTMEITCPK